MTGGPARIRVGFDGRALSSPAGGVRRYAHELFWALAECEEQVELVALGPPPGVELPPASLADLLVSVSRPISAGRLPDCR